MRSKAQRRYNTEKKVKERSSFIKNETNPRRKGRLKKHHPHDCGSKDCYVCHSDKLDKVPTKQQVAAKLHIKESLND